MIVDSCILLDLATKDPVHYQPSLDALTKHQAAGGMFINPVIYAEVCRQFTSNELFDRMLRGFRITKADLPYSAARVAADAFYCAKQQGRKAAHILPDFLIAGHAISQNVPILTRDKGTFSQYFSTLRIVRP